MFEIKQPLNMDTSTYFIYTLIFFHLVLVSSSAQIKPNYNNLVYKNCANQTLKDESTSSSPTILHQLFQELVEKSSQTNFFETITGNENTAISGLFQCRGDLSSIDCYNCMKNLPKISKQLCGHTIPARIQLSGCHIHYEPDEIPTTSRLEVLHKTCGEHLWTSSGFLEIRDAAFAALSRGITSGNGFCDTRYEGMRVMGQCEGKLDECECGECVSNALEIAQGECGYSVSGDIYLQGCFISYSYNSDGSTRNGYKEEGKGSNSGKLVAIVLGGAAALAFGFLVLGFIRSLRKKDDDW